MWRQWVDFAFYNIEPTGWAKARDGKADNKSEYVVVEPWLEVFSEVQAGLRGEREASGRVEVRVAHVVSRTEVDYSGGERTEFLQASNETATCYFDRLMYFSIVEI